MFKMHWNKIYKSIYLKLLLFFVFVISIKGSTHFNNFFIPRGDHSNPRNSEESVQYELFQSKPSPLDYWWLIYKHISGQTWRIKHIIIRHLMEILVTEAVFFPSQMIKLVLFLYHQVKDFIVIEKETILIPENRRSRWEMNFFELNDFLKGSKNYWWLLNEDFLHSIDTRTTNLSGFYIPSRQPRC